MTELRTALNSILAVLKHEVDFDLWMITRVVDDDWIMLSTTENSYKVKPDDVIQWSTSVCSRMVALDGPNIVPVVDDEESYAQAPITHKLKFKSYIGYPLKAKDGKLMGTLCAIDPSMQDPSILSKSKLLQDFVTVVESLMQQHEEILRLKTLLEDYMTSDSLDNEIGLPNEEAFFNIAHLQKERMQASAMPLALILVEIKKFPNDSVSPLNKTDGLIKSRDTLSSLIRNEDLLFKLKGNRFGILVINTDSKNLTSRVVEMLKVMQSKKFKLSVGAHVCRQNENIQDALRFASERFFG